MSPSFFFQLLWSRRWLISLVALTSVGMGYLLSADRVPRYTAAATLVLGFDEAGPFDQTALPRYLNSSYVATQVDIIKSHVVADRALRDMEQSDREAVAAEHLSEYHVERLDDAGSWRRLVESVLGELNVSTARASRVVALRFTSIDPVIAAKVVNALAEAYVETSLGLSIGPARRNAEWFDQQQADLRKKLEEKQAALTAYQKEKGIISSDDRLDSEVSRYRSISADLLKAQARANEVRAGQLGAQHPEYRRAVEQERALRDTLARQERRVFEVKEERDKLDLLVQDVDNARQTYDIALKEYYQSTMEGQFNQSNVAILSRAMAPTRSISPSKMSQIIGSAIVGLLLGIMFALAAELLNRKIRNESDIKDGLDITVIASI